MVDAAGQRNPGKALSLLNALLRDQPLPFVFSMVARQFRLLIIAKEIMQEGGDEYAIAAEGNLHAFVAKKRLPRRRDFPCRNWWISTTSSTAWTSAQRPATPRLKSCSKP